jgi:hypothetical protein
VPKRAESSCSPALDLQSCISCSCPGSDPSLCHEHPIFCCSSDHQIPHVQGAALSFAALGLLLHFSRRLFSRWSARLSLESAGPSVKVFCLRFLVHRQLLRVLSTPGFSFSSCLQSSCWSHTWLLYPLPAQVFVGADFYCSLFHPFHARS